MAEFGIIASVIQIADVGLRLSVRLYTFGEIVASADRSVISISKDVSLTSSVLKELGQILGKDEEGLLSRNAIDTADTVAKECLEVFEEMESILLKKMPNLRTPGGKTPKAVLLLERVKWSYLQPKLQLLCSNLDRLKSTLLLMLNVITYARQVSGKSEPASVVADQRSLIEDLARSNQEYIRRYEGLKLAIEAKAPNIEHDAQAGSQEDSLEYNGIQTVDFNTMNIIAGVQGDPINPDPEAILSSTEVYDVAEGLLLTHLEHYLDLLNNLLEETDEDKYAINTDSRTAMKAGIGQIYEREMRDLVHVHDLKPIRSAEEQLAPQVKRVRKRTEHAMESQDTLDGAAKTVVSSHKVVTPNTEDNHLPGMSNLSLNPEASIAQHPPSRKRKATDQAPLSGSIAQQEPSTPIPAALYVQALHDFDANKETGLSFKEGDVIQVTIQSDSGWWDGVLNRVRGFIPSNFCVVITGDPPTTNLTYRHHWRPTPGTMAADLTASDLRPPAPMAIPNLGPVLPLPPLPPPRFSGNITASDPGWAWGNDTVVSFGKSGGSESKTGDIASNLKRERLSSLRPNAMGSRMSPQGRNSSVEKHQSQTSLGKGGALRPRRVSSEVELDMVDYEETSTRSSEAEYDAEEALATDGLALEDTDSDIVDKLMKRWTK